MGTDNFNEIAKNATDYTLQLLKMIGFWRTILFILVLVSIFLIVFLILRYANKLIHYKENREKEKIEKEKRNMEERKLQIQEKMSKQMDLAMNRIADNSTVLKLLAEKLQISIQKDKYDVLVRSFLGIDYPYLIKVKYKLYGFFESDVSNYLYLYEELISLYHETVLTRLHVFIFRDRKEYEILREKSRKEIITFLDKVKEKYIKSPGDAEDYIEGELGLYHLGQQLKIFLMNYYEQIINKKYDIGYIGKSE